jgi:hypothetical protein
MQQEEVPERLRVVSADGAVTTIATAGWNHLRSFKYRSTYQPASVKLTLMLMLTPPMSYNSAEDTMQHLMQIVQPGQGSPRVSTDAQQLCGTCRTLRCSAWCRHGASRQLQAAMTGTLTGTIWR